MANFTSAGSDTFPATIFNFPPAFASLYHTATYSAQTAHYVNYNTWHAGASHTNISHQSTYGGGFQVTNAGKYYVSHSFMSTSGEHNNHVIYRRNGSSFGGGWYDSGTGYTRNAGQAVIDCSAGDKIDLYQNSNNGYVHSTYSAFNIVRVG